jgi:hypothetical protein
LGVGNDARHFLDYRLFLVEIETQGQLLLKKSSLRANAQLTRIETNTATFIQDSYSLGANLFSCLG